MLLLLLGPAAVGLVLQAGTDLQQLVINVPVPSLHMGMGGGDDDMDLHCGFCPLRVVFLIGSR